MPRLLRAHFASIGHRDARLAPLTLDFRHATEGTGADSVVWLRNGGGKSSVINLFFSIFRPSRREFLGSSAEGKARRIEDYIKAQDLACAVTEWDVTPLGAPSLFAEPPRDVRIVGQALSWKGLRRSKDTSNLRRLFFSIKAKPGVLDFDEIPVQGLGEPESSFEHLRDWLRETAAAHPGLEITTTESQRAWLAHLEKIGIDSELFRYQIRMNLREGAADEAFRFASSEEFIRFLLDLALDHEKADLFAQSLEAQRHKLEKRPSYERERSFIAAALGHLEPLVRAVEERTEAEASRTRTLTRLAGFCLGLRALEDELEARHREHLQHAEEAQRAAQAARNERDKHNRWARGLLHRACELDVEAAKRSLEDAEALRDESERELKVLRAARHRRRVLALERSIAELERALQESQKELEPLLRAAQEAGGRLHAALEREQESVVERLRTTIAKIKRAASEEDGADATLATCNAKRGRLEAEIKALKAHLSQRDRTREELVQRGHIEIREPAAAAATRWQRAFDNAKQREQDALAEENAQRQAIEEIAGRRATLIDERARHQGEAKQLGQQVEEATRWRDQLVTHRLLLEIEGVEEAELEADGLEERLRRRAQTMQRDLLASRVDGAEDLRALAAIDQTGLLPPSRDVEEVMRRLKDAGIHAFSGPGYIADNYPDECVDRLRTDPSRHAGAFVLKRDDLRRIAQLGPIKDLRAPVQVSLPSARIAVADDNDDGVLTDHLVLLPDSGIHDHAAADKRRIALDCEGERRAKREASLEKQRRELETLADELQRFLEEHGRGALDRLVERQNGARAQAEHAAREINTLETTSAERKALEERARVEVRHQQTLGNDARSARVAVEGFITRFERDIEEKRTGLEAAQGDLRAANLEHRVASEARSKARERLEELNSEKYRHEQERDQLELEQKEIAYRKHDGAVDAEALPDVDELRDLYRTRSNVYKGRLGESTIQGKIEAQREQLSGAQREFVGAKVGLEEDEIDARARRSDLDRQLDEVDDLYRQQIEGVGLAKSDLTRASDDLNNETRRREARDLPPNCPDFPDGKAARAEAERNREVAEGHNARSKDYEETKAHHEERAQSIKVEKTALAGLEDSVQTLVEGTDTQLPEATPLTLPEGTDARQALRNQLRKEYTRDNKRHTEAVAKARSCAHRVRTLANDERYQQLELKARERMRDDDELLMDHVDSLTADLRGRSIVLERSLADLERDRRMLVEQLAGLGDDAHSLLQMATRASLLPASLEGWANRSYLRIAYDFPRSADERRARLEPLLDRLVSKAEIPSGLDLVKKAVIELAGARGFDVKILKPDTTLRPDPVPITAMISFSRGQQLTAAILLYCTLVQLRARSRGRAQGMQDAGILVLDNPIGTCSNVALLELQRTIANKMRVQLIYATGVDDLEALATLPNLIRLRNVHRDRRTGDNHVTHIDDNDDRGAVEAVRIVEVPAR